MIGSGGEGGEGSEGSEGSEGGLPTVAASLIGAWVSAPERRGAQQPLDVLDRDVLWEFATGLWQAYETASLRRTLRRVATRSVAPAWY